MRNKIVLGAVTAVGMLSLLAGTATAAPATGTGSGRADTACADVRLPSKLPVPPAGMSAQQDVSIGSDCVPHLGPVRFVPSSPARAEARAQTAAAPAITSRQVRSWSEMYDCCNIRMTALSTSSTWDTADNQVTNAVTELQTGANREPWDAGWSLKTSSKTEGGPGATSQITAHAEFSYRGIFDPTGNWYATTHDTSVQLNGDGTAWCQFDITLRHTFIGWNSVRGCA
ncbi:hypothetical protein QMK19_40540 [Streptomyces sp. H10-C2]|uniref:hypothetical protein n=1 Tax=unclassified Streptomyces TaxID=2593676 RepID=UPI0024BBBF8F|nr:MULTISPECIES: hypothetical protein [unclassified Streptomyces]MDJ0347478.1 hypothetical protein [Streptomyces sp. PH10-H1]MDJ0375695.1 hypothetical protein [Streptomyces sp. H10-C2]